MPQAARHPGPPVPARATRPLRATSALVESHRAKPRAEDLDALSQSPPRELKKAVAAMSLDAELRVGRRWAAVVLHTDAALRRVAPANAGAADEQRAIALELLGGWAGRPRPRTSSGSSTTRWATTSWSSRAWRRRSRSSMRW